MQNDTHQMTHDVLVVGAGPAGLTAAISLARHGIDVLVIEKHAGTSPFPKATGISTRTMELLRGWGLEERIRAGSMRVEHSMAVSETLIGPALATMPFGYPTTAAGLGRQSDHPGRLPPGPPRTGAPPAPAGMRRAGPVRDRAHRLDHRRRRHHRRAARSGHRPLAAGSAPATSSARTARAARCASALGIGVEDLGTIGDFVAVTFRADLTRQLPRTPSAINAVQAAGAEGMFVPTSTDDRWIYARQWHPELGRNPRRLDPAAVRRADPRRNRPGRPAPRRSAR